MDIPEAEVDPVVAKNAMIAHMTAHKNRTPGTVKRISLVQSVCVLYIVESVIEKRADGCMKWGSIFDTIEGKKIMDVFFHDRSHESLRNHHRLWFKPRTGPGVRLKAEEYLQEHQGTPLDWFINEVFIKCSYI